MATWGTVMILEGPCMCGQWELWPGQPGQWLSPPQGSRLAPLGRQV